MKGTKRMRVIIEKWLTQLIETNQIGIPLTK
jgi:hypothetical protein